MVCLRSCNFPRLFRKYQSVMHICVFIVVFDLSAENEQRSFSTLRLYLEKVVEMFSVFFQHFPKSSLHLHVVKR